VARLLTVLLVVVIVAIVVMWIYALFFASKEAVNKIDDRAWADRAEAICDEAQTARRRLADFRTVDEMGAEALAVRADLVEQATDLLETMLDDVTSSGPTDEKGRAIVPQWEADYRTYLDDRRAYIVALRAGENDPFAETIVDGIPISEKLATFAADNEMPSCAPPDDLAV
jgi:hypothetical protein